ncbi:HAMP domain-containing histidine kinase [Candidatus Parcubacteria bacterium]|nr:HAMP domain-containing histidine kinase [Candidatus Parcubacteria bacterium]
MTNFWKQFVGWGTELKDDPFVNARFKLTLFYTIAIGLVFLITNEVLMYTRVGVIENSITTNLDPVLKTQIIHQINEGLQRMTIILYGMLTLALVGLSFIIGGRTLSPIRQIVRAQKRFIADASHELRTPLAIMKTNSEVALLDGEHITSSEAHATLQSNLEEMNRMSKIIENLLSLSYYDNRFTEIPFSAIKFSDLVTNITNKSQSLAVKKAIELQLTASQEGLVLGNPTALEQLTINLVKNAVTYTQPHGRVTIEVCDKGNHLELRVKDNGVGIAEKDLPNIFSPFYKAGESRTQEEKGSSGLGLTIVRKIVDRHKGTIEVHSKLGKGTTVLVSLPKLNPKDYPRS